MICKHCNTEAPEGAKFCLNCGKKFPLPKLPVPQIADELIIRQVDPVLKTKEAAQLLKVSNWMIYELVKQNKIPHFLMGNRPRFVTKDLLEWASGLNGQITTAG